MINTHLAILVSPVSLMISRIAEFNPKSSMTVFSRDIITKNRWPAMTSDFESPSLLSLHNFHVQHIRGYRNIWRYSGQKTSTISGDIPFSPPSKKKCVVPECPNLKIFFQDFWTHLKISEIRQTETSKNPYPNAPCMEWLPTLGQKWQHLWDYLGKYSLCGASGIFFW